MKSKTITFEQIEEKFRTFIDSCGRLNFFTRSKRLQENKIHECSEFVAEIKGYKVQAVENDMESAANEFFLMQCMVNALKASLSMWVNLKSDQYQKSWSYLIDAQEYTNIALKMRDYEGLLNLQKQLTYIEESVFPGWALYNSPGFIETVGKCSICGKKFIDCGHIENQIYRGSLCQRVERKVIELNHTAVVENPRDKRCIITQISDDDGNMIDYFTWEKTGEKKENNEGVIGHMESVLFVIPSLDVF